MSTMEIVVVVAGLFLGYWIVSKFLFGGPPTSAPSADRAPQPPDAPSQGGDA